MLNGSFALQNPIWTFLWNAKYWKKLLSCVKIKVIFVGLVAVFRTDIKPDQLVSSIWRYHAACLLHVVGKELNYTGENISCLWKIQNTFSPLHESGGAQCWVPPLPWLFSHQYIGWHWLAMKAARHNRNWTLTSPRGWPAASPGPPPARWAAGGRSCWCSATSALQLWYGVMSHMIICTQAVPFMTSLDHGFMVS